MAIQITSNLPGNTAQSVAPTNRPTTATVQPSAPVKDEQPHQEAAPVHAERVKEAVDTINRKLQESNQQLRFSLDSDTGKMVVRVVDTATGQVIRQIPSEVALAISQSLEKLQGLLVRQQA